VIGRIKEEQQGQHLRHPDDHPLAPAARPCYSNPSCTVHANRHGTDSLEERNPYHKFHELIRDDTSSTHKLPSNFICSTFTLKLQSILIISKARTRIPGEQQ
jgi:hypothetical protein